MDTAKNNMGTVPGSKLSIKWDDPTILTIIVAIVTIIISIVIFSLYLKKRVKQRGILLVGLSNSGKTLIFTQLVYKKFCETYTSIKENCAEYEAGNKSLQIIDIPGQERVRNKIFDDYKNKAIGIVFVIDSLEIQKELRDVAEYLYNILCDEAVRNNQPRIVVLCNKQDETMAKGSSAIKSMLEKEINIVRKTKTGQLDSIDNKSQGFYLGRQGQDFDFKYVNNISFSESTATAKESEDEEPDLGALEQWLLEEV